MSEDLHVVQNTHGLEGGAEVLNVCKKNAGKRPGGSHPEGLLLPLKEGLGFTLKAMGSFGICPCPPSPAANGNPAVAQTCHLACQGAGAGFTVDVNEMFTRRIVD